MNESEKVALKEQSQKKKEQSKKRKSRPEPRRLF
jgi:hypothetical protein